jgi:hypothetical protein
MSNKTEATWSTQQIDVPYSMTRASEHVLKSPACGLRKDYAFLQVQYFADLSTSAFDGSQR